MSEDKRLKAIRKDIKKLMKEIESYEKATGRNRALVEQTPGYITSFVLIIVGISLIIVGGTRHNSDDDSHWYYISGSLTLTLGILRFLYFYFWTSLVQRSDYFARLNAYSGDTGLFKNLGLEYSNY